MPRRFFCLALLLVGSCFRVPAKEPQLICGTSREAAKEEVFLHRQSRAQWRLLRATREAEPIGKDVGDIAVMYDSGGVVARRNPFNLEGRSITFTPNANHTAYRFTTAVAVFDETAAQRGAPLAQLGDDDTRRLSLPFRFPFFGSTYETLYVNSDGNISFQEGDARAMSKSIGLLAGGPPRIAALFADLDPSRSLYGVRVLGEPSRVVVTWLEVPEYRSAGTGPMQTFQLRLYADGRMEIAYRMVNIREAVVGISPGRAVGLTEIVSFSQGSGSEFRATVAESFTAVEAIDTVLLAQRFYQTHDDAYDYLVVYNTLGIPARSFAVATELTIRSRYRAGFGDTPVDLGREYGSAARLQAFLNMGSLAQYPMDPRQPVAARGATGDTPLSILAHEVGHLFLALASIRDEADPELRPMLGAGLAHWSFNFNSDASFLEGNRILDKGENANPRFETVGAVERYSSLDQYLMGFRAPDEVPPLFLVRQTGYLNSEPPRRGVLFNGQRQDFTVQDIIAAEGRRSPDHTLAQRRFRAAIILLVAQGAEPSPQALDQLETLRRQFEEFFRQATDNRAVLETSLKRNLRLSLWPAAGVVQGATLPVSVLLDRPAEASLTVILRSQNGNATLPASLTIAAGAREATFSLRALRAGVEEIVAEPDDTRYRADHAFLYVAPSLEQVELQVDSGDKQVVTSGVALPQAIAVRATDINLIPYPGLTVRARVTDGGTAEPAVAVTGADGIARFRWTPGNGAVHQLTATLEANGRSVAVEALGRPFFQASAVLNAASYAPGISPGSLGVVFGTSLAGGSTARTRTVPWPTELSGVQLRINGAAVPLYHVSDGQINFLAPRQLAGPTAEVEVWTPLGRSAAVQVPVNPIQPGLFFDPVTREAAVLVAGTGRLTSQRPAAPGEFLEIYATGLGAVQPSGVAGLQETVVKPIVRLGGVDAEVSFSGMSPAIDGLYQINARVPENAPRGVVKLSIEAGGVRSNEADVTLAQ